MFGAMPDANGMSQLLQNPAISQMMQSLLSNPQYMNQVLDYLVSCKILLCEMSCSLTSILFQMLGANPQFRSMLDSNSQFREMMQNPEFLRQLTSPETMQVQEPAFVCAFIS